MTLGILYLEKTWDGTKVTTTPKILDNGTYTIVTSSDADVTWAAGKYIVNDDVTINGKVKLTGDVELILSDGKTLTVNNHIDALNGGTSYQHSLTIYAQSDDASTWGKLTIQSPNGSGISFVNTLTIHSGEVVAKGGIDSYGSGCSGIKCYTMTVNGGVVNAQSHDAPTSYTGAAILIQSSLTINDGVVKAICGYAQGGSGAYGIRNVGTITINGGSVEAKGCDVTGTGYSAGCGINASSLTIKGSAVVKATGGSSVSTKGGDGIDAFTTIDGGTVTATGGNSTDSDAGHGCYGTLLIQGGQATILAGHGGTGHTGSSGGTILHYYGGSIIAIGDVTGKAISNNLYNKSGAMITVYTNDDGSTTDFPVSAPIDNDGSTTIIKRGMKIG